MKVNAFGRDLEISRQNEEWLIFDLGVEGKKRLAHDIVIPAAMQENQVLVYLADLLHERATSRYPNVKIIGWESGAVNGRYLLKTDGYEKLEIRFSWQYFSIIKLLADILAL